MKPYVPWGRVGLRAARLYHRRSAALTMTLREVAARTGLSLDQAALRLAEVDRVLAGEAHELPAVCSVFKGLSTCPL
jgi:hypothetical protein